MSAAVPTIVYANPYFVPVVVPIPSEGPLDTIDPDAGAQPSELNYSTPIPVPDETTAASTDAEVAQAARQRMEFARRAFQLGNISGALSQCEQAIQRLPGDSNLHEFRALCQFALGRYQDASGTLYAVLAAGPGWDWNTLGSFYLQPETYHRQLRSLEDFVSSNPRDAGCRFVLAYHYLVLDERAAALEQLREVVRLQPKDTVSAALVEALEKGTGQEARNNRTDPGMRE